MNHLRELRKQLGIGQKELAATLHISQPTVSEWESGKKTPSAKNMARLAGLFGCSLDYLVGVDEKSLKPPDEGIWIPVLGSISAGVPLEALEEVLDYEEISEETASLGEHFALRIQGRSMEPRMQEGDVVIIRKQSDADSGDTVAVLVNGGNATIKRLKKTMEGIMLLPNNPQYEPLFFTNKQIHDLPVSILGKVVELRGKF